MSPEPVGFDFDPQRQLNSLDDRLRGIYPEGSMVPTVTGSMHFYPPAYAQVCTASPRRGTISRYFRENYSAIGLH